MLKAGKKIYVLSHKNNEVSAVLVSNNGSESAVTFTEDMVWIYDENKLSYQDNEETYYLYVNNTKTDEKAKAGPGKPGAGKTTATLGISRVDSAAVSLNKDKLKIGDYYLHFGADKISLDKKGSAVIIYMEQ